MGQAKRNQRECPALGRKITPLECGEGRITRIACLPQCPHNPFAPAAYAEVQRLEEHLRATLDTRLARDPATRDFVAAAEAGFTPPLEMESRFIASAVRARDAEQRTFFERWRESRWEGLRNDERVLAEGFLAFRLALIRIERVWDDVRLTGRDLLDPSAPPFEICDRALAQNIAQYTSLLVWLLPTPHYQRIWALGLTIPIVPGRGPREVFEQVTSHLGFDGAGDDLIEWVERHYLRVQAALSAVRRAQAEGHVAAGAPDFGATVAGPESARTLVPPGLITPGGLGERDLQPPEHAEPDEMQAWLDEAHPALENVSPRAAAADPTLRPRLQMMLEVLIERADFARTQGQAFPGWNPLARELGFADLQHHLPADWTAPLGRTPASRLRGVPGTGAVFSAEPSFPLPPWIEWAQFREPPIRSRPPKDLDAFGDALHSQDEAAMAGFLESFPDVLPTIETIVQQALAGELENDLQTMSLKALVVVVGLAGLVVEEESPRYALDPNRTAERVRELEEGMVRGLGSSDPERAMKAFFARRARWPDLAEFVFLFQASAVQRGEASGEDKPQHLTLMAALILGVLDELDAAVEARRLAGSGEQGA